MKLKPLAKFALFWLDKFTYSTLLLILPIFFTIGNWIATSIYTLFIFLFFVLDYVESGHSDFDIRDRKMLFGLLVFGFLAFIHSPQLSVGLQFYVGTIVIPILLFIILSSIKLDKNGIKLFLNLILFSGLVLGLFSIYLSVSVIGSYNVRLSSIWVDFNIVAAYFMIIIFFNILLIMHEESKLVKILYIICLIIVMFGLFLTQTRGVWLSLIISIAFYIIRRPKVIFPALVFIGIFLISFFPIILNRFLSVKFFLSDWSAVGRLQAWIVSLLIIKDNFLFGAGFQSFYLLKYNYFEIFVVDVIHSHNTYLRLWVEMGIFGFIFYIFFFIKALILSFKVTKFYKKDELYPLIIDGLQMSFVGLSIAFMFEPYFSLYGNSTIIIWLLIGVTYNLYYKH